LFGNAGRLYAALFALAFAGALAVPLLYLVGVGATPAALLLGVLASARYRAGSS
jgi:hypothetical protein